MSSGFNSGFSPPFFGVVSGSGGGGGGGETYTAGNGLNLIGDEFSIDNVVVATISGSTFTGAVKFDQGLSGSLTRLADGTSYLIEGTNVAIVTGSNGSITISSTDTNTTYTAGAGLNLSVGNEFSIDDSVVATVSGSTFTGPVLFNQGLSGSLTQLADGTSYLIEGSNITITSASNGAVTIASTGGGAADLANLGDVDLTGLQDGDIILYDSASSKWVPATFPSGSISGEGLISYRALIGF